MKAPRARFASLLFLLAGCIASPAFAQNVVTDLANPAAEAANAGPRVAFETSMGRVVVELYPEKAPRTVANFLGYVRDGHYNGTVFHRVIADLLIQGGAFTPDLQQKPEHGPIVNESNNGLSNLRGTLSCGASQRPEGFGHGAVLHQHRRQPPVRLPRRCDARR